MAKKPSEDDFVNEGLSEEENAAIAASEQETGNEAEAETQTAPEAEPGVLTDQKPGDKPKDQPEEPKTVDLRALQEARAENRELRERYAKMEERTNIILQQFQARPEPEKQEETPPDPNEDIFAYTKWQAERLAKLEGQMTQRQQQEQEAQQQNQQRQALFQELNTSFAQYQQVNPNANAAADFLVEGRRKEYQALGYDPQTTEQMIANEALNITWMAKQRGQNPAEVAYNLAVSRGYAPAPEQPQKGPEDVAKLAQQQQRHMSLSDATGGEAPKPLDAKALASMSDAQFNKLMSTKEGRAQVDEIMGTA